jgi:hypothetical protein
MGAYREGMSNSGAILSLFIILLFPPIHAFNTSFHYLRLHHLANDHF